MLERAQSGSTSVVDAQVHGRGLLHIARVALDEVVTLPEEVACLYSVLFVTTQPVLGAAGFSVGDSWKPTISQFWKSVCRRESVKLQTFWLSRMRLASLPRNEPFFATAAGAPDGFAVGSTRSLQAPRSRRLRIFPLKILQISRVPSQPSPSPSHLLSPSLSHLLSPSPSHPSSPPRTMVVVTAPMAARQ